MKRIAHIVTDEKFIDDAFHIFNLSDGLENTFFCLHPKSELTFIKQADVIIIRDVTQKWIEHLNSYDLIVFHSLIEFKKKEILIKLNKKTLVLWIGWGADYYFLMGKNFNNLYFEKTNDSLRLMKKYYRNRKLLELASYEFYKNQFNKLIKFKINRSNWLSRIDYFSPVLVSEFEIIKRSNPDLKAKFIKWNYPIKLNFDKNKIYKKSNNLLLGNSASYYNNHIDALNLLSNLKKTFSKIIVPLNYGGDLFYINRVIDFGNETFGDQFYPLLKFYTKDKYYHLIDKVSHAVFYTKRQLAMGNIYFLLSNGVKIFLCNQNPAYRFLLSKGYVIYEIADMNEKNLTHTLSEVEAQTNFTLAHQFMGQNLLLEDTKNLFVSIFSDQI